MRRLFVGPAGVLSLLGVAMLVAPDGALGAGQVELVPAAGARSTATVLEASGFAASSTVRVTVAGKVVRSVKASRAGRFRLRVAVPRRSGAVTVVSRSGPRRVRNLFLVTSRAGAANVVESASSTGARVRVSPRRVRAGGAVELRGTGFPRGRRVKLRGLGAPRTVTAGRHGTFQVKVTVPASTGAGQERVVISGAGRRVSVGITVSARGVVAGGRRPPLPPEPPRPAEPPLPTAPSNAGTPGIVGVARVGETVSATTGTWQGTAPLGYAYQWQRCAADGSACRDLAGASGSTHAVTGDDAGGRLRVIVRASNAAGSSSVPSPVTAVVTSAPLNVERPVISGTPQQGRQLKAGTGVWTGTPTITYAYEWRRCTVSGSTVGACTAIPGATKATYTAVAADVSHVIVVAITATNGVGHVTAVSSETGVVLAGATDTGEVALWHMDEASGNVMTDSNTVGPKHDGTLMGAVTPGQLDAFAGRSYRFGGVTGRGRVEVPAADLNPGDRNITVTIRLKADRQPPSSVEDWDLLRKGYYRSGIPDNQFKVELYPDGRAACGFAGTKPNGSPGKDQINGGPVLQPGTWHEITCKKTAGTISLTVDGNLIEERAVVIGSISSADPIVVGAHPTGSEYFEGLLDEASIKFG